MDIVLTFCVHSICAGNLNIGSQYLKCSVHNDIRNACTSPYGPPPVSYSGSSIAVYIGCQAPMAISVSRVPDIDLWLILAEPTIIKIISLDCNLQIHTPKRKIIYTRLCVCVTYDIGVIYNHHFGVNIDGKSEGLA